jgi:voltage-gated potassium channel Kch
MDTTQTQPKNTLREIFLVIALLLVIIAIGITFYHNVEGLRLVDAIYFTTMTLTTVGYGDFVPQTDIGKIFTSVYAFLGIGTFLGVAGILFHNALTYSHIQAEKLRNHKDKSEE